MSAPHVSILIETLEQKGDGASMNAALALGASHRFVRFASVLIKSRPQLAVWGIDDQIALEKLYHDTVCALGIYPVELGVGAALEALYADRLAPSKVGA
jgi:hypothetical protein